MRRDTHFVEVRPRRLSYHVRYQLRKAILDGVFRPGQRLIETDIAREMNTSRGPIREAIQALEQEGLVKSEPWRGARVVELDPASIRSLVELRILLETFAAKAATERCDQSGYRELEQIVEQMQAAAREERIEEFLDHDIDFHRCICRLSGNPLLLEAWERISGRIRLMILLTLPTATALDLITTAETHPLVVEAMAAKDDALAARLLNERTWEAAESVIGDLLRSRVEPFVAEQKPRSS
jgi:DNA-binding GntR family transcriptional regulator